MATTAQTLLSLLDDIKGNGSFETSGIRPFLMPGLTIKDVGQVAFPMLEVQIKQLIEHAHQAPFGKGSATITDTSVRNTWEVDAADLSFSNPEWQDFITDIVQRVQKKLSIEKATVRADLYKLLIYEKGGFFLPHKDSEKAKGMFATLSIGLPAVHEGGELHVRFDDEEEVIDFAPATGDLKIPYAAFFADCEHEIKPVRSGYRVCLVYNLIQENNENFISLSAASQQQKEVTHALQKWAGDSLEPKAILLGHQYTPENFSLDVLKHHDVPRAAALINAAENAGFYARLGLVTCYKMGDLIEEYDYYSRRRRRRYDDDYEEESKDGKMGDDIYEEYIRIENWGETQEMLPHLGDINLDEADILTNLDLMKGDPTEQEQEGYTGNAGMTIEYWYHYGAVVLWSKKQHQKMLTDRPKDIKMQWLGFYLKHWEDTDIDAPKIAKELLSSFVEGEEENDEKDAWQSYRIDRASNEMDFSPLANALVQFDDENYLKTKGLPILQQRFEQIDIAAWERLIHYYSPALFAAIFMEMGRKQNLVKFIHLLKVVQQLATTTERPLITNFVQQQLNQLPVYLETLKIYNFSKSAYGDQPNADFVLTKEAVELLLSLYHLRPSDNNWQQSILTELTLKMPRPYVNEALIPVYMAQFSKVNNPMAQALLKECVIDLKKRTVHEPLPPADWSRPIPSYSRSYSNVWEMLTPFLQSPTQQVFSYIKNESYRKEVERAIRGVKIDLRTETIRSGRPYTLNVIKTQSAYEAKIKKWKKDLKLLAKCEQYV